ncbi:hypothetical protein ACHAPE_002779 [Trichoderma viride]
MTHVVTLPTFKQPGDVSTSQARAIAEQWVKDFESALQGNSTDQLGRLFTKDAWMRDLLSFSWDFRCIQNRDNIVSYFQDNHNAGINGIHLQETGAFQPTFQNPCPSIQWIQSMFEFESRHGRGKGTIRLVVDGEDGNEWKCYLMHFRLKELKGHEEKIGLRRPGSYDASEYNWQQRRERQTEFLDEEPTVLIVGAGQSGLAIGARLQQLGIPSLIIERLGRVGDTWRNRYKTLSTHDPVHYCHLPYIPFPSHWPMFTPKDKLADWLESYASLMELNVWCSTELQNSSFDEATKSWSVSVKRTDGSIRDLKPKHVILATGSSGEALIPHFDGIENFKGTVYHASKHKDASEHSDLSNKRVVVVGAGNSSHDICQNFYNTGAGSVTMLQRGGTYVLSAKKGLFMLFTGTYEEGGPPIEECDVMGQSMPLPINLAFCSLLTKAIKNVEKDTQEGLAKAGFQLDYGEGGGGLFRKYLTLGGGYYIDVGCSQLITDGKVKVKANPGGIKSFTPDGLVLADGSELKADIVVLATGYQTMRSTAKTLFGDKVASRLGKGWGMTEEGEMDSIWRYSGHPNFWFMGGNLALCRGFSQLLALQIKASELGIYETPGTKKTSNGVQNGA